MTANLTEATLHKCSRVSYTPTYVIIPLHFHGPPQRHYCKLLLLNRASERLRTLDSHAISLKQLRTPQDALRRYAQKSEYQSEWKHERRERHSI